jgi:hypothetical protein
MVSSGTDGGIIGLIVDYDGCQTTCNTALVTCCASANVVAGILYFT